MILSFLFKYKYLTLFFLSIVLSIIFLLLGFFDWAMIHLGRFVYLGAFITGMMFAFTLTAAIATIFFVTLGTQYNPILIAILGGIEAMVSDLLLYEYIKHGLIKELKAIGEYLIPTHKRESMEQFTKKSIYLVYAIFDKSADCLATP